MDAWITSSVWFCFFIKLGSGNVLWNKLNRCLSMALLCCKTFKAVGRTVEVANAVRRLAP